MDTLRWECDPHPTPCMARQECHLPSTPSPHLNPSPSHPPPHPPLLSSLQAQVDRLSSELEAAQIQLAAVATAAASQAAASASAASAAAQAEAAAAVAAAQQRAAEAAAREVEAVQQQVCGRGGGGNMVFWWLGVSCFPITIPPFGDHTQASLKVPNEPSRKQQSGQSWILGGQPTPNCAFRFATALPLTLPCPVLPGCSGLLPRVGPRSWRSR